MVVNADSKWPEIIVMLLATASATVQQLRHLFAACGYVVVTASVKIMVLIL